MSRENTFRGYGCVADLPEIIRNDEGKYVRGAVHLAVIRSERYSEENDCDDRIMYDCPIIISVDEDIIKKMAKLKLYDTVEVEGMFVTKKVPRKTYCPSCGQVNTITCMLSFVMPTFLIKRGSGYTKDQSIAEVMENRPISNNISFIGNLCNDVNYFHEGKIQTSVFQIAVERRLFVTADLPENRTDFPIIRTYGKQAKKDSICIHKGTLIHVDGYLHTRTFMRKVTCEACKEEYETSSTTTETIPIMIQYLNKFTDPNEAQMADEAEKLKKAEKMMEG